MFCSSHPMPDGRTGPFSISVAIVTRNRPRSLERCLESWRRQTVAPDEIVVSDDSDDALAASTEECAARYRCRYTRGPRRGLYANRNHAALTCRMTHIISADDDHTHPVDYLAVVRDLIAGDPRRVWVFGERDSAVPDAALTCPPELHRSGMGGPPRDPSRCASIADGSTVFPREVFDNGLRYDESFRFGPLWYLWGKLLASRGWRISYSDRTFVWHHLRADGFHESEGRLDDRRRLQQQLLAMTYVQFVNALWIDRSPALLAWATAYLLRRMVLPESIIGFNVQTRIPVRQAMQTVRSAYLAEGRYRP
jgi:glycosyltransferase involved in cell wall biosynthesis